jgi:adenylyl-sulfate kinase
VVTATMNRARGVTVWLTGRPASGKTTIAVALESALRCLGEKSQRIDGDELRKGLCRDLGFSKEDRAENVRRAGQYALAAAELGNIAIVSLVSPYVVDRRGVRDLHRAAGVRFIEVHVDCPLEVAEARDPKGLYRRARAGQLEGLTGFDAPYEPPTKPELVFETDKLTVADETARLLDHLGLPHTTTT